MIDPHDVSKNEPTAENQQSRRRLIRQILAGAPALMALSASNSYAHGRRRRRRRDDDDDDDVDTDDTSAPTDSAIYV